MKYQILIWSLGECSVRLLLFLSLIFICQNAYGQIPQNQSYQKDLYSYLASLTEDDFKLELAPLTVENHFFSSEDELYKTWLVFGEDSYEFPSADGIRVDPKHFTLNSIESNGEVYMETGRGEWISALTTGFFADWDYRGNPHYDSRAVKLRAFVAAAVDMMMADQAHDEGEGDRSDFLGGQLIQWAYAYNVAKDVLPEKAKNAFERGLIRMFEKMEKWGPTGIHADMDTRAAPGVLYVAKSVESEDLTQRAYKYIDNILTNHFKPAGYIDHGGAYDASYNGISLFHLNWAAYLSDYEPVHDALKKMIDLKAHLTLPDPDGDRNTPHHSNSSSSGDAAEDQWTTHFRNAGLTWFSKNAYALLGKDNIVSESKMLDELRYRANLINNSSGKEDFDAIKNTKPGPWKREHWTTTYFNYVALNYKNGLYNQLLNADAKDLKLPFNRDENFIKSFDNKFLSAKQDGYGVILFNDRLSWWTRRGDTQDLNGFGGGNISAFWTPSTGSVLLGVARGTRYEKHHLSDWEMWPVHALSGETEDGKAFSSAIQREPESVYALNQNPAKITVMGDLANDYSDPRDGLQGKVNYEREFTIEEGGVKVKTSVSADGTNIVNNLFEILPVFLRNESHQPQSAITNIDFYVDGVWRRATREPVNIKRIRLKRFEGEVFIEFSRSVSVKLSPKDFYIDNKNKSGAQIRNIMIDLLDKENLDDGLSNQSITYKIYDPNFGNADFNEEDKGSIDNEHNNDVTIPNLSITHNPNEPDNLQKIVLSAQADDESGIEQMQIIMEEKVVKTCHNDSECMVEVGPIKDGKYTYYATATDPFSNTAKSEIKNLIVFQRDTTAPSVTIYHTPETPDNTQKITINAKAEDESDIKRIQILVDDEVIKSCEDNSECVAELGPYTEGIYSYTATATDHSLNMSESEEGLLHISNYDSVAPEITLTHSPEIPDSNQALVLEASATDAAGIDSIDLIFNGKKVKTCTDTQTCIKRMGNYPDGHYSYQAIAWDINGNKTETLIYELKVVTPDTAQPGITVKHSPESPNKTEKTTLTAKAENISGVADIKIFIDGESVITCKKVASCSVEVGPYQDGTYNYYATVTDYKSNVFESNHGKLEVFTFDNNPPKIEVLHSPQNPVNNQKVTFTVIANDDVGVEKIELAVNGKAVKTCNLTNQCHFITGPFSVGDHTYSAKVTDHSVNQAYSEKKTFRISSDNRPPFLTYAELRKTQLYLETRIEEDLDPFKDTVYLNYDWRIDNNSIALVNMPFDLQNDGTLKNYTNLENYGIVEKVPEMPEWTKNGKRGGALKFDGIDDQVRISEPSNNKELSEFTIESWIMPDNQISGEMFIYSSEIFQSSSQKSETLFYLSKDSNNKLKFIVNGDGNEQITIRSKQSIPSDQWVHIVGTYDGEKIHVYINGKLDNIKSYNEPVADAESLNFFIGKSNEKNSTTNPFKGLIDEVKLINIALADQQVKNHFQKNYERMSLSTTKDGQNWRVAVTANDTETQYREIISNEVTTFPENDIISEVDETKLSQNYPNPFNDSTTIRYNLDESQTISIKIYDLTGRLVQTVFEGVEPAGLGSKTFYPKSLTSGVYFYQLVGKRHKFTKKMTYVK